MDRRLFLQSSAFLASSLVAPRLRANPFRPSVSELENSTQALTRIAFGSCNRIDRPQTHWQNVVKDAPELWIWLGDNVYADHFSVEARQKSFQDLKTNAYYQKLRDGTPIIGTWDDHDFAFNNADGSFADKDKSKDILMNFLDIDSSAPVWNHDGVYQSYGFGPSGQRVQVILLDLRWDMIKAGSGLRLLSLKQWDWLENEIRTNSSDLLIIGSSLNVTSPITGLGMEGWRHFPEERAHLYELLDEIQTPTILLSGDRHFAEIYKQELKSGREIFEVMSSGLTHSFGVTLPHPGRLGKTVGVKNYGLLEIDWSAGAPVVNMQIKGAESYGTLEHYVANF